jgi:hypothetical protein
VPVKLGWAGNTHAGGGDEPDGDAVFRETAEAREQREQGEQEAEGRLREDGESDSGYMESWRFIKWLLRRQRGLLKCRRGFLGAVFLDGSGCGGWSRSVCANLAEAWRKRRYQAAFVAKLDDAEAEAAETQTWIQFAVKCNYLQTLTSGSGTASDL